MELVLLVVLGLVGWWAWRRRPVANALIGTRMSEGWQRDRHAAETWREGLR